MEYINIKLETVGDIRFVGARPVMRATWLSLLVYCAKQENSGRIANCRSWGNDTWAQIAGLRKSEVHAPCGLWSWEGDDLVVWGYPIHNEQVCRLRRDIGRAGGIASGSSRRSTKREPNGEPFASPNGEARLEQKGKEKEREENTLSPTPARSGGGCCTVQEALAYAQTYNAGTGLAAGRRIDAHVVTLWHDDREKVGWVTGNACVPIVDWQADLRAYAQRYTHNESRPALVRHGSPAGARPAIKLSTQPKQGF